MRTNANIYILLFCNLFAFNLFAQSKGLILYKDFLIFDSYRLFEPFDYEPKAFNDYGFAIAYQFQKKDKPRFNQIELKYLYNSEDSATEDYTRNHFNINYKIGKYSKKNIAKIVRVKYGLMAGLHYFSERRNKGSNIFFPIDFSSQTLVVNLFGGLEIPMTKKINLLFDLQWLGASFGLDRQVVENPALTPRQRRTGGFDFDLGGERIFKIGLSYSIIKDNLKDG